MERWNRVLALTRNNTLYAVDAAKCLATWVNVSLPLTRDTRTNPIAYPHDHHGQQNHDQYHHDPHQHHDPHHHDQDSNFNKITLGLPLTALATNDHSVLNIFLDAGMRGNPSPPP